MLIRNGKHNISVATVNGYTVKKVKKAIEFVKKANRRTPLNDYLQMYNYLKDTNEVVRGCNSCAYTKYKLAVERYAKYGYLTLVNTGTDPSLLDTDLVETKEDEHVENEKERINLGEKANDEKAVEEVKKEIDKIVKKKKISKKKINKTTVEEKEKKDDKVEDKQ